jgi:hypothetical protein
MKKGKCELCHAVADLHDSHYMPKSGYKKMRATELKIRIRLSLRVVTVPSL